LSPAGEALLLTGETLLNAFVVGFAGLVCIAAIVVGFIAMMHKS
jgi:hypothetical protein